MLFNLRSKTFSFYYKTSFQYYYYQRVCVCLYQTHEYLTHMLMPISYIYMFKIFLGTRKIIIVIIKFFTDAALSLLLFF